ncbi:MAG: vWA domain-containing protein [Planctomycetaceae bacterium]
MRFALDSLAKTDSNEGSQDVLPLASSVGTTALLADPEVESETGSVDDSQGGLPLAGDAASSEAHLPVDYNVSSEVPDRTLESAESVTESSATIAHSLLDFGDVAEASLDEPVLLELAADPGELTESIRWKFSMPSTAISIVLHIWLMVALANYIRSEREIDQEREYITTEVMDVVEEKPLENIVEYQLAPPVDDEEHEVQEVVMAQSLALSRSTQPKPLDAPQFIPEEVVVNELSSPVYDIPEGLELDDRLVVKGSSGNGMIELESALDRVTWEIAQNLKESKVLVVWMLDASGSLTEQRGVIAQRMQRIYGELGALQEAGQIPRNDQPLLSGVVAFGEKTFFAQEEPTDNVDEIVGAVGNVINDPSGKENVFGAVRQTIDRWAKYRAEYGRRIMLIVVTDEAGDDYTEHLELAIGRCRGMGVRAYVIGPPAVFGRRQGLVPYVAPENGRTYQLPVDMGPESAVISQLWLPFWYSGPQHDYMTAGFGPYALTRLVRETGGVYFMTNMTTAKGLATTGTFDPELLRPFEPDYRYGTPQSFLADMRRHPLRRVVVEAAMLREDKSIRDNLRGTPVMEFRVDGNNFKQVLGDAQKPVAISTASLETLLAVFPPKIDAEYEKEPSQRWRMEFNLAYGRLLAQKVRYYEYNYACAALKNDKSAEDVNQRSNHWIFQPDDQINYATSHIKAARKAQELLNRVVAEAPGTPWAVHAARELRDPFGIKIIERFIPPPPPPPPAPPGRNAPQFAPPPPPPQTPVVRPPPPVLPKL